LLLWHALQYLWQNPPHAMQLRQAPTLLLFLTWEQDLSPSLLFNSALKGPQGPLQQFMRKPPLMMVYQTRIIQKSTKFLTTPSSS
jgi:hypothetical protein